MAHQWVVIRCLSADWPDVIVVPAQGEGDDADSEADAWKAEEAIWLVWFDSIKVFYISVQYIADKKTLSK